MSTRRQPSDRHRQPVSRRNAATVVTRVAPDGPLWTVGWGTRRAARTGAQRRSTPIVCYEANAELAACRRRDAKVRPMTRASAPRRRSRARIPHPQECPVRLRRADAGNVPDPKLVRVKPWAHMRPALHLTKPSRPSLDKYRPVVVGFQGPSVHGKVLTGGTSSEFILLGSLAGNP